MEQGELEPNIFFKIYGSMVDSFFAVGKKEGDPITIIPPHDLFGREQISQDSPEYPLSERSHDQAFDVDVNYSISAPSENPNLVVSSISKGLVQKAQEVVDSFRRILNNKSPKNDQGGGHESEEEFVVTSYLKDFRTSLQKNDETLLDANPFYELTKQVYQLGIDGVGNAFKTIHGGGQDTLPKPIPVSRTLREIWLSSISGKGLFDKLSETFGKWIAFCRTPLSLLLFAGSTYTTARGVNDLLQTGDIALFFGDVFDGRSGEGNRYFVCLASGLILSSAILDYKTRIFQSIVETGTVLKGIGDAFLRNPRWMLVATLLTFVSIKTNYDGIVSIISKKEDLAQQSFTITTRVRKALGSPFFMDPLNPDSLFDLQGSFQESTKEIKKVFLALPEDEVKGVASSGDARKGPRYWAKHFIIHGGYEVGVNDVTITYNNSSFARNVDGMMKNSGIDFNLSLAQKIDKLQGEYEAHLTATDESVRKSLDELNGLMRMEGYSPEEIKRVLALEHYQINDIVQGIVSSLEENKHAYKNTVDSLGVLTNSYLEILQIIDKSGTSGLSAYHIKAEVDVPEIEAIYQLREGKIPVAKHKSFAELRASLIQRYGVSLGGLLLAAILFFSISMDLGDPIIYSRMTARRGKKDRIFYQDRLAKLKLWEDALVRAAEQFFHRSDVRAVLIDPQAPGETVLRSALFKTLEMMNKELQDPEDKSSYHQFDHWFRGMFRFSRTNDVAGLNCRIATLALAMKKPDKFFPVWGSIIYPDFLIDKKFARTTFQQRYETTTALLNDRRVLFYQELRGAVKSQNSRAADPDIAQSKLLLWADKKGIGSIVKVVQWWRLVKYWLLSSTFIAPLPGFSYTRKGWLRDFSENSLESEKIVESIYGFIPDLKKVVFETLPAIQEEYLEPVIDFLAANPGYESARDYLNSEILQSQFDKIEKEALDLWGVSFFASDDPGGYLGLSSIIGQEELTNLQGIVERTGTDSVVFSKKVDELADSMKKAYEFVSNVEEMNQLLADVRTLSVDVNQSLMKIKMRAWEFRGSHGNNTGGSQYLDTARDLQFHAPKEAENILSVMEAILLDEEPYTKNNLLVMRDLQQQAADLQDRIVAFVDFDHGGSTPGSMRSVAKAATLAKTTVAPEEVTAVPLPAAVEPEMVNSVDDVGGEDNGSFAPEALDPVFTAYDIDADIGMAPKDGERVALAKRRDRSVYESQHTAPVVKRASGPSPSSQPRRAERAVEPPLPHQQEVVPVVDDATAASQSPIAVRAVAPEVTDPVYYQADVESAGYAEDGYDDDGDDGRSNHHMHAIYKTSRGDMFEGEVDQLSLSGVDFISINDTTKLPIGNHGTIALVMEGGEEHFYSGKVVRVQDARIVVQIVAEHERFENWILELVS